MIRCSVLSEAVTWFAHQAYNLIDADPVVSPVENCESKIMGFSTLIIVSNWHILLSDKESSPSK